MLLWRWIKGMKQPFRRPLLYSALAIGLLCPNFATAEMNWLDEMDAEFEKVFQKSDQAFDRALQEGVNELDLELAAIWGRARQLPESKKWVGYSKDKTTRIIVDYDKGEMSFEGMNMDQDQLEDQFNDMLEEDSDRLNERAVLRRKLIEKVNEYWKGERVQPSKKRIKRTVKTQPRWKRSRELSNLVAPRARIKFVKRDVRISSTRTVKLSRLSVPLKKNRDNLSAQILRDPVINAAQKYGLPRSLILSVIKNESSFNPRARSHANALGLMQLVPTSGGKEAYSYLMGKEATPGPDVLYDPIENIMLGATYLHLLNTRYFGKVKDKKSRLHLIIASYNTGAGNVSKAFTGKMKLRPAIQKINQMTSDQVYEHLIAHLPYAETKTYLSRVTRDTKTFAGWDDTA